MRRMPRHSNDLLEWKDFGEDAGWGLGAAVVDEGVLVSA
jgi:hypothetical protein